MSHSIPNFVFPLLLLGTLALTPSCHKNENPTEQKTPTITIERLSHTQGKFSIVETIELTDAQKNFTLGGKTFTINARWEDAEVIRLTNNDNPREAHAIELIWTVGDTSAAKPNKNTLWIFPSTRDAPAPRLAGTQIQPRLLPPGTHMTSPPELKSSLLNGVQFQWQKKRYNLPQPGNEAFPGWKITAIRTFQHALLKDNGTITEAPDAHFINRAVEVTLQATDGTKERHICFIDHPQLTAGIHPSLLPVTRISGKLASLSRLVVCERTQPPVEKSLLTISPDNQGDALTLSLWVKGKPTPETRHITHLPTTITLDGQHITLARHWTHARRQIKWQQKNTSAGDNKQPALLIESGGHFHAKSFVLIQGESTPCRLSGNMMILRYR